MIAVLGVIFGYIIGYFTREELADGERYFRVFQALILAVLAASFYGSWLKFGLAVLAFGLGFFGVGAEYILLGYIAASGFSGWGLLAGNFLTSSLVFLYGLPYGSRLYLHKRLIGLLLCVGLFLVGAIAGVILK